MSAVDLPPPQEPAEEAKSEADLNDRVELDEEMFSSAANDTLAGESSVGGDDDDDQDDDGDFDDAPETTEEDLKIIKRLEKSSRMEKKRRKEEKSGTRKKSRKDYRLFDEDVEVVDDDEEEEDYGEEREVQEEELTKEELEAIERIERRQKADKERLGRSAEDIAAEYEQRHKDEAQRRRQYEQSGGFKNVIGGNVAVAQQALLPSVTDPKIFKLKCKTGFELQLVRSLLLKAIDMRNKGGLMKIKSAFTTSVKGYIYVEALSEAFAKEVLLGINYIYQSSFSQIPVSEMTSVLSATLKKKPLRLNQWVRLKRGPLKGDLARVVNLLEGGTKAFVQAVPRPDYTASEEINSSAAGGGRKTAAGNKIRPQQRLFEAVDAKAAGAFLMRRSHPADRSKTSYDVWNNDFYLNGFLYKEVNVATYIDDQDVKPRLEELQLFQNRSTKNDGNNDDDEESLHSEYNRGGNSHESFMKELAQQIQSIDEDSNHTGPSPFVVGDLVQVTGGDMQNMIARVLEVNDSLRVAKVLPYENTTITTAFEIEVDLLVKHIFAGAHVKVTAGRYMGQTGRVVSVHQRDGQTVAAILTDAMNSDIQCNVGQLQLSTEVSAGHGDLMGYELYDLVAVNENECAVVTTVGAERLRIINHMGVVRDILPAELLGKRNHFSIRSSGFDMSQNPMKVGDTVKVASGTVAHANMSGTVKHILKGTVWLHSTSHLKNSGIFVAKARSCVVAGSNFSTPAMSASYKGVLQPTPTFNAGAGASPGGSSLTGSVSSSPAIASRAGAGAGRSIGRDAIVGKTVKIKSGAFKGLLAQVVDATPTHLSVELLAKLKKITIERHKANIVGDQKGKIGGDSRNATSYNPYSGGAGGGGSGIIDSMSTPFQTADTPSYFHGNATPAYVVGSETPMYVDGSATPLGGVGRTPGRVGDETDALWNVNEMDRANIHGGSGSSVNTSMQNSPGSLYGSTGRPTDGWVPSTGSSYQPQTEYSTNSHSQLPGNSVDASPMSIDQQSQHSQYSVYGNGNNSSSNASVASNVAEVGSVHSSRTASTRMSASSGGSRATDSTANVQTVSPHEWEKDMVVRITAGAGGNYTNRTAVLQSEINSDGTFMLALRSHDGLLMDTLSLHYGDLRLEEVVKRQLVKVLTGKFKGMTGEVKVIKGKDAFVILQQRQEIIKLNNLAWIHTHKR